jgi:O-antigen/teichoic acid export membrane protein
MHPLTPQDDQPTTSLSESVETIGRETAKGAIWSAVGTVVCQTLIMTNNAVVARYVLPSEYGIVGMAMVVVSLTGMFVTFGMVPAILSGRLKDPKAVLSAHWLMCAAGIFMAAITCASSPLVAHFFGNRQVIPLLLAASSLLVINAWRVVPNAVLVAAGRFDVETVVASIAQVAACATGITMAVMGAREWAVLGPSLVIAVVGTFFTVLWSPMRIRPFFAWRYIKAYAAEGCHLMTNSMTEYIFNTSDQVVVGRMLGAYPLGIYNFGGNLVSRSLGVITPMVSYPLMSSLGRAKPTIAFIDRASVRAALGISRITLPISIGGILVAPYLIRTLAGPHWIVATEIVRICFVLGAVQSLLQLATTVWMTMGRSKLVMYWGLTSNVAVLGVFILGAWSGSVNKVALAYMLYTVFLLTPLCLWCTRRWCQLPLKGLATGLLRILRDAAIMALGVWAVNILLNRFTLPAPIMLAVEVVVGVLIYAACFRLSGAAEMGQFLSVLPARMQSVTARLLLLPVADKTMKAPTAIPELLARESVIQDAG